MHDHDHGFAHDLKLLTRLTERRRVLTWMSGAGLLAVFGCGSEGAGGMAGAGAGGASGSAGAASGGGSSGDGTTECSTIPEETAGPYPGDGSNGANALVLAGIVRSDIRSSFAGVSGAAEGVPLSVKLTVVDANGGCVNLSGLAVYVWHCDRDGLYSMYTIADQNYLRGVQETAADGSVTFTSIFPACYPGRWPHIHFEVYASVEDATSGGTLLATSQLALPQDVCEEVYSTADGYDASVANLAQLGLNTDMVFSDGSDAQLASVTGSVDAGYTAVLTVAVAT